MVGVIRVGGAGWLNSKGQVTIPAPLRAKHDLQSGDEVEVVEQGGRLMIVRADDGPSRGQQLVDHLRGRAGPGLSTDELMAMLRGED